MIFALTSHFQLAFSILGKGGIIILPTDTLYGFSCDACNDSAIRKLNELKGRKEPLSIIVSDIEKKSAGEEAGILIRDVIYKVNGKSVNSANDIEEILDVGYFKTGDQVEIIVIRNNQQIKLKLKLINPHDY